MKNGSNLVIEFNHRAALPLVPSNELQTLVAAKRVITQIHGALASYSIAHCNICLKIRDLFQDQLLNLTKVCFTNCKLGVYVDRNDHPLDTCSQVFILVQGLESLLRSGVRVRARARPLQARA